MKKTTKSIIQNVILGVFITLILLAFTVQAAPPVVIPHDGADCGTDPYPAINSPDYRIDCYGAKQFDPNDPTWSEKADWIIVRSNDPHAQNQIHKITGTNLEANGAYGIDREAHVVNKGNNNAVRVSKDIAENPYGGYGNDITGHQVIVESTLSNDLSQPNEHYGEVITLKPNATAPADGDFASTVRTLSKKHKWKVGYYITPGSAEVGLSLGQSMLVRGPRSYEVYDDQGIHTFECNAQGQKCQRRKTEWFIN